jgi:hypothetical protein
MELEIGERLKMLKEAEIKRSRNRIQAVEAKRGGNGRTMI